MDLDPALDPALGADVGAPTGVVAPGTRQPGTRPPGTRPPGGGPRLAPAPADVADPAWRAALDLVLAEPERLLLHVQPIVETQQGTVAGYEALSRFDGPFAAAPDRWFAAAEHWGSNALLQGRVVAAALGMRRRLPPDTFLTVNVDPHLFEAIYRDVLGPAGDLSRIVLELTEHTRPDSETSFAVALAAMREQGALVAVDDAGTGYSGLTQLLSVRPDIVKLDREIVAGVDVDPVKAAMVATIGDLVGRMDAWVLAEGAETLGELDTLVRLGVPLVQGYVLARPTPGFVVDLPHDLAAHLRATSARSGLVEHVASLVRTAPSSSDPHDAEAAVLIGADGRVKASRLVVPAGPAGSAQVGPWCPAVVVAPAELVGDVARRAAVRPALDAAAPLVCTDGQGRLLGVVTHADLLLALAARA